MMKKWMTMVLALVLTMTLMACGGGEETTLTGMVVSVDGTVISLMEMDASKMENTDIPQGERPNMPQGMEGFENFDPENFDPENFNPEDFNGTLPEGEEGEMPDLSDLPEDMTMPENGEIPNFPGAGGGFGNFQMDGETKEMDIANAHISVEIDGGKASGTMDDIQPGTFVTLTVNGKGEVTYVLVSSMSGFGGWMPTT